VLNYLPLFVFEYLEVILAQNGDQSLIEVGNSDRNQDEVDGRLDNRMAGTGSAVGRAPRVFRGHEFDPRRNMDILQGTLGECAVQKNACEETHPRYACVSGP
jgi:hypothetical protein